VADVARARIVPRAPLRVRWTVTLCALPALLCALPCTAQEPGQEPAQQEETPEILPDLRIVRMEVAAAPMVDGGMARVRLILHNRSPAVAAGNIAVELVHDRRAPQPLPVRQQVLYLGPDGLAELEFQVPSVQLSATPYTFFAKVDVDNAIREADETNNTAWQRAAVCGGGDGVEVADGFDNDCDGMIDEETGLPADPSVAVSMLRELQRRNALDAVPLVYALARPFAPAPVRYRVQLASEEGDFVGPPLPQPGGRRRDAGEQEVVAQLPQEYAGARLELLDWNGGGLASGDLVSLRDARGETIIAGAGGGARVLVRTPFRMQEELFTLVVPEGAPGDAIASGSGVALATFNGSFVSAEGGGGGAVRADRARAAGWETFTLTYEESR